MFYIPFVAAALSGDNPITKIETQFIKQENAEILRDHSAEGIFYTSSSSLVLSVLVTATPELCVIAASQGFEVIGVEASDDDEEEEVKPKKRGRQPKVEKEVAIPNCVIRVPITTFQLDAPEAFNLTDHPKYQRLAENEKNAGIFSKKLHRYSEYLRLVGSPLVLQGEEDDEVEEDGLSMPRLNRHIMDAQTQNHQDLADEARDAIEDIYAWFEDKIVSAEDAEEITLLEVKTILADSSLFSGENAPYANLEQMLHSELSQIMPQKYF